MLNEISGFLLCFFLLPSFPGLVSRGDFMVSVALGTCRLLLFGNTLWLIHKEVIKKDKF